VQVSTCAHVYIEVKGKTSHQYTVQFHLTNKDGEEVRDTEVRKLRYEQTSTPM